MNIGDHLIVLQIIIPLMAAPLCVFIRNPHFTWALATVVSWICLAISIALIQQVTASGEIIYELGGWAAPWGIEYRVDMLNAWVLVIVTCVGAVVTPYAKLSAEKEIDHDRLYIFYAMLLLCETGLLGITVTGDAFNLFVFLEISALSTYVLISMGKDRRGLTAAYRYLILGTLGATLYIIGVGLLYMQTGSLNIADLAKLIPAVADSRTVQAAMAFMTVGLCIKLALFPLHMWLPNAYAFAPSVVTVFLAATATKVGVYALVRVIFTIFGGVDLLESLQIRDIIIAMAIVAMFAGSAVAIYQTNIKRMLAYSSLAQIGYMILGLSMNSVMGVSASLVHLFNHAMTKGGLFMVMGCVVYRISSAKLDDMAGLGKQMPLTMGAFVLGGLSLIGVPLTAGFVSKWALIQAALEKGWWPVVALIVISSLMAVVYIWRVVEVVYFKAAPEGRTRHKEAPLMMIIPMLIMICTAYYFGINGVTTMNIAGQAAEALIGGLK
jgi:multicomponent Na+:H+ antiporter subunit D